MHSERSDVLQRVPAVAVLLTALATSGGRWGAGQQTPTPTKARARASIAETKSNSVLPEVPLR